MPDASPTRPRRALLFKLGAVVSFVAMQALVKSGRAAGLDTTEVMFLRSALGLPVLYVWLSRQGQSLRPNRPLDLGVRSLLGSLAMGTNFTSMRWLTLAQFSTLGLLQPVLVALGAPLLLGERVGRASWLALFLGGLGAYVLLAPALEGDVPWVGAALGACSALFSALAHIWVRRAAAHDPPERVVFYFAAIVTLGSLLVGVPRGCFTALPEGLGVLPFLALALGLSTTGTLGQVLLTRAYLHGEAAYVALLGYAAVPLSMLLDTVLFARQPPSSAWISAALMIAAGLLITRAGRAAKLDSARM